MRSSWKLRVFPSFSYRNNFIFRSNKKKPFLKIFNGSLVLARSFLNKSFRLYNGKKFKVLKTNNKDLLWKYIGEFNIFKKMGSIIHKTVKKSQKKKKK